MWEVKLHKAFEAEFQAFEPTVQDAMLVVAKVLADFGPQLGRPHVDTLKGSKHANMKELRFEAADGEWRAAFAFDPERNAIVLVAGDKSGGSQKRFYRSLIAKADLRFSDHLESLKSGKRKSEMARSLNEIISELPPERQADIEARYQDLKQEVEGLRELRQITGKAQAEIATALNIKQPSVSKIEKQADMYLSTLRSYVEAVGGKLELMVKLPKRPAMRIHHLGDVAPAVRAPKPTRAAKQRHG